MKLDSYLDEFQLQELRSKIYEYYRINHKLCLELNELVNDCYNAYSTNISKWSKKLSNKEYKRHYFKYYGSSGDHDDVNLFFNLHDVDIVLKHKLYSVSGWTPAYLFAINDFDETYSSSFYKELEDDFDIRLAHDIYVISNTKVNDSYFMNFCVSILKYTSSPAVLTVEEITYLKFFEKHYELVKSIFDRRFTL